MKSATSASFAYEELLGLGLLLFPNSSRNYDLDFIWKMAEHGFLNGHMDETCLLA